MAASRRHLPMLAKGSVHVLSSSDNRTEHITREVPRAPGIGLAVSLAAVLASCAYRM